MAHHILSNAQNAASTSSKSLSLDHQTEQERTEACDVTPQLAKCTRMDRDFHTMSRPDPQPQLLCSSIGLRHSATHTSPPLPTIPCTYERKQSLFRSLFSLCFAAALGAVRAWMQSLDPQHTVAAPAAYSYPADYKGDYVVCPGAIVDESVIFDEGCVVLPGARILVEPSVPKLCRLRFGRYCLVEEHALIRVRMTQPTSSTVVGEDGDDDDALVEVQLGAFTHLQSRSSLELVLPAGHGPSPRTFQTGHTVVMSPFASLMIAVDGREDGSPRDCLSSDAVFLLGDHTLFMPYAAVTSHTTVAEAVKRPVVAARQVVLPVPAEAAAAASGLSCADTVPRGGVRSVAEISGIVESMDRALQASSPTPDRPPPPALTTATDTAAVTTPLRPTTTHDEPATQKPSACRYVPARVMDRTMQEQDDDMDADVQKRCRYYLEHY